MIVMIRCVKYIQTETNEFISDLIATVDYDTENSKCKSNLLLSN